MRATDLASRVDAVLERTVHGPSGIPGVIAGVTDRASDVYLGTTGVRTAGDSAPMTPDTVFAIFSATKAVTATVCLQLVEEERLDLDAPAERYVPELGTVAVLEGFDSDGAPRLRPPTRPVTTRMLLLHTAGFAYEFFNEAYLRLAREHGQPSTITATRAALRTPLLFDPGERWEYGSSIDWAGQVVEAITGRRLGEVMAARIFEPLGMADTAFVPTEAMRLRRAGMHRRRPDGSIRVLEGWQLPPDPELDMGGHGLYSTVSDYLRFLRLWLDDGRCAAGRLLRPETIRMAAAKQVGAVPVAPLHGVHPALAAAEADLFPGLPASWGLSFLINERRAPTGRPAGSLGWAGLANLYYWIDRSNGLAGFWAEQLFPFADPASVRCYLAFESAVYAADLTADAPRPGDPS